MSQFSIDDIIGALPETARALSQAQTDLRLMTQLRDRAVAERDRALLERNAAADQIVSLIDDRLRLQKQVMAVGELAGRLAGVQEVHPTLHRALEGDTPHQERGRYAAGVAWDIARDLRAIVGGTAEGGEEK